MRKSVQIVTLLPLIMIIFSCESDSPESSNDKGGITISDCLGSIYPEREVINPDDPQYEDNTHTQEQVRQMFAQAKEDSSGAYWAYKAAFTYADLTTCAFCYCGCASSSGHLSAVDCFKDLHGFG